MGEKRKLTKIYRMDEVKLEAWKRKAYAAKSFTYFSLRTQLLDIIFQITFGIDESKWSWYLPLSSQISV